MANALPQKHLPFFFIPNIFCVLWMNKYAMCSVRPYELPWACSNLQHDILANLRCRVLFNLCTVAASHFATCLAQFFNAIQAISDLLGSLWCPLRSVCLPAAFLLVFHVCMKGWGGHRTTVPPNINNLDGITIQLWLKWSCQNYSFTQWTLVMVQCYWTTAVLAILKDYNTKLY